MTNEMPRPGSRAGIEAWIDQADAVFGEPDDPNSKYWRDVDRFSSGGYEPTGGPTVDINSLYIGDNSHTGEIHKKDRKAYVETKQFALLRLALWGAAGAVVVRRILEN